MFNDLEIDSLGDEVIRARNHSNYLHFIYFFCICLYIDLLYHVTPCNGHACVHWIRRRILSIRYFKDLVDIVD